jgi:hypothetical protein
LGGARACCLSDFLCCRVLQASAGEIAASAARFGALRLILALWLTAKDFGIPLALLMPYLAKKVTTYKVSTRVNSLKNNDARIIEPVS